MSKLEFYLHQNLETLSKLRFYYHQNGNLETVSKLRFLKSVSLAPLLSLDLFFYVYLGIKVDSTILHLNNRMKIFLEALRPEGLEIIQS